MTLRTHLAILACLTLAPVVAGAATLQGELVNGTTGTEGSADRIELLDVAQGMTAISTLENVSGSFEIADVPETSAHLLLRITRGDVTFSQNVEDPAQPLRVEVYDRTEELGAIEYARHHVIFRRDAEHMLVTELFEFDNQTDPPMTVAASAMPMRFGFENPTHGAPQASVGSSEFPVTLPVIETGNQGVRAVDRPLRPGMTRMFISYAIEYDPAGTQWTNTMVYPAQDRRVLVTPTDVQVMVDQMIPTESPMEGFAAYAGLAIAAEASWTVRLAGGSAIASNGSAHDHGAGAVARVEVRPHRFADQRILMMIVLAALLGFGLLLGVTRKSPAGAAERALLDEQRMALSRLADRYISGELDRAQFEHERDRLLGRTPKAKANGHSPAAAKKASTAAHTN